MKNINNIEEAKKYIGKIVYTASNFEERKKYKIVPLYIGGVNLFYNQVNYDVIGFYLYEDKQYKDCWGDVKKDQIVDKFDPKDTWNSYFFSKEEAEKYRVWSEKDDLEREKEEDLRRAEELLKKHKVNYEIFN